MAAIPAFASIASGISAAAGIGSAVLGAVAQKRQGEAEAEAAEFNAKVQEQKAREERERAAADASDFRRKQGARRASSIAQFGSSGVKFAGTPLLVDTDVMEEIDLGAARIGQGGESRATAAENTARLDRMRGRSARRAGNIGAGASLLGGTARTFGRFV